MPTGRRRAPRPAALLAVWLPCLLLSGGCVTGLVYEHTHQPLDVNFDDTPSHLDDDRGERRGESWKRLVIPTYLGPSLEFDWGDASIATALEDAGITRVHYADLETRSVLRIWTEYWVHVYGEGE